jgi:hypothetical protein
MTELSPAALAVWEYFNQDEAGAFVDYGYKIAAVLRIVADQTINRQWSTEMDELYKEIYAIAAELEAK